MIDFNWTEVFFLAVMAVILFGPERLPDFARKAARVVAYLRRVGDDARGQLRSELGPEFDDITLADLNPKTFVARHILSAVDKEDLLTIRDEFRSAGEVASGGLKDVRSSIESARGPGDAAAQADDRAAATGGEEPVAVPATPFDPEAT